MRDSIVIEYRISTEEKTEFVFEVRLAPDTLDLEYEPPAAPPEWARLEASQCPCCPLEAAAHPYCPVALAIAGLVARCGAMLSYERVAASVHMSDRVVSKETSAQRVLSSLVGLLMATSGCPILSFLKPMARFHLPFATVEETVFRAAGTYLLGQYFVGQHGRTCDLSLDGLQAAYTRLQRTNIALSERLRYASKGDAGLNAIVLLDVFAKELPWAIDEKLEELAVFFQSHIDAARRNG